MSVLTFMRNDPDESVSAVDAIRSINRLLERQYPDCTCFVLATSEPDKPSHWVTIELEITHASLGCVDWYRKQAEAHRLKLTAWKPRPSVLEADVANGLSQLAF